VSWDKSRPSKCFYIDDIKDIRVGRDAENYRREFGVADADEPRFFSILYASPRQVQGPITEDDAPDRQGRADL
jgi:phosphatidylinositol phospholipase C delta